MAYKNLKFIYLNYVGAISSRYFPERLIGKAPFPYKKATSIRKKKLLFKLNFKITISFN